VQLLRPAAPHGCSAALAQQALLCNAAQRPRVIWLHADATSALPKFLVEVEEVPSADTGAAADRAAAAAARRNLAQTCGPSAGVPYGPEGSDAPQGSAADAGAVAQVSIADASSQRPPVVISPPKRQTRMLHRFGIVGLPNAGKSTVTNWLVGGTVSAVRISTF
jgi:hypothetical protein